MKPVLLDTGCIVALLDRSERHHKDCAEIIKEIQAPLVTCEAVIAESCYLLREMPGASEAVLANVERGIFRISFQIGQAASALRHLMSKYKDIPMDLADACLVCMAGELKTGRILTLDNDFSVYRWNSHQTFEMLLPL